MADDKDVVGEEDRGGRKRIGRRRERCREQTRERCREQTWKKVLKGDKENASRSAQGTDHRGVLYESRDGEGEWSGM